MTAGEGAEASAAWVEEKLAEARTRLDLPALARRDSVLMADTRLSNIFTCQPQQKNSAILTLHVAMMHRSTLSRCRFLAFCDLAKWLPVRFLTAIIVAVAVHGRVFGGFLSRCASL